MSKYLLKRLLHGLFSLVVVVAIVMTMIYSVMDRNLIFAKDGVYTKQNNNSKIVYKYQKWEEYGYLDYVSYADYLAMLVEKGELDAEEKDSLTSLGKTEDKDSEEVAKYVVMFKDYYKSKGYEVERLDAVLLSGKKIADGGRTQLFAYKDIPLWNRLFGYFTSIIKIDNIDTVKGDVGDRGISFTFRDPVYGGEKFSPAIIGNGTHHKYLLYFNSKFPYIHQNIVTINLGSSYSVNKGIDVFETMTATQGSYIKSTLTYPTGLTEESADDLHTATYVGGSTAINAMLAARFTDDYTGVQVVKNGMSKMGYSFVIGIISTLMAYCLGIPVGLVMARKKDKLVDKLGTIYIVFIIAVPSLAYIFLFKAIGGGLGLPTTFNIETQTAAMYVLPIVSLALPSVANLMKWSRRYMIDQMNSDYVKFARSGGLTEGEIFSKHILKNAAIPIVHGIPGSILFAMTGAIITERVYTVPGTGNLLTTAINQYDNGVIVGLTLFYAVLSIIAIILGDLLMAMVDPRISFLNKEQVGGNMNYDVSKLGISEEELFSQVEHSDTDSEKIAAPRYSYWQSVFRVFFKKKINIIILCVLLLIMVFSYVYPMLTEYDKFGNVMNAETKHLTPMEAIKTLGFKLKNILGTGSAGQSTFDAVWFGSRISISLALVCAAINMTVGVILGAVWGFSKKVDMIMMEVYNIIGNIPYILFISVMVMLFSPSFLTMVLALTITGWLGIAYFIRTQVVIIRDREYNLASKCLGTSTFKIAMKNILPFMTSVIVTLLATEIPSYISYEVFLSYIGMGLSDMSLGRLIFEAESAMLTPGWQFEFWSPVAVASIITVVLYVVGQNLGDASDPRTHM